MEEDKIAQVKLPYGDSTSKGSKRRGGNIFIMRSSYKGGRWKSFVVYRHKVIMVNNVTGVIHPTSEKLVIKA